jgi:hypothetical protein
MAFRVFMKLQPWMPWRQVRRAAESGIRVTAEALVKTGA